MSIEIVAGNECVKLKIIEKKLTYDLTYIF